MKIDEPTTPPPPELPASRSMAQRLAIWALVIFGLCFFAYAAVQFLWRNEQLKHADALTRRFEQLVDETRNGDRDLEAAIGALVSVDWEYGPGAVQTPGSNIDNLVERYRRSAKREILSNLRERTGVDLGEDPQAWLAAYRNGDLSEREGDTSRSDSREATTP